MEALISEFEALNNEEIKNIRIDLEEIVDLVGSGDSMPFALSNLWETQITKKGLDYAKNYGYKYAIGVCVNKGYYTIYQEVLKQYIEYYISILEEEYSMQCV
jgi:hypothetical protein